MIFRAVALHVAGRGEDAHFVSIGSIGGVKVFDFASNFIWSVSVPPKGEEAAEHGEGTTGLRFSQLPVRRQLLVAHPHVFLVRLVRLEWLQLGSGWG